MVTHDEALCEGFVAGHGEASSQLGESDEQQAQAVLAVHGEVGEESEVFEDVVAQVLGFVDDEHGELFGFTDEACDFGADGALARISHQGVGKHKFQVSIESLPPRMS